MIGSADGGVTGSRTGNAISIRVRGPVGALEQSDVERLMDRSTSSDEEVRQRTAAIVARVRREGDAALIALAAELDEVDLATLEVPRAAWQDALMALDPALRAAMERAMRNIEHVHRALLPDLIETSPEPGIIVGRRADPLGTVGIYAPGGRAAYPSSVLMGAVPARVAGVGQVVVCSPPTATGLPSAVVLAAAELANVDRLFAVGGAGAIAAMAWGTATIPHADRIVGPGNAYVAEAKLQVAGAVGIDAPAGPSELLVLADCAADAAVIAREMIGQAEHDPRACAVAIVFPSAGGDADSAQRLADRIAAALGELVPAQPRAAIVASALADHGAILTAPDAAAAVEFANRYAAEHVLLVATDASALLGAVRNAGTVFVGAASSNAFGDYMTGANHVLPTGGLARSYSGLSVLDFMRWTTYQQVNEPAAASLAESVGTFADAEGLPGHAAAARAWARATPEARR